MEQGDEGTDWDKLNSRITDTEQTNWKRGTDKDLNTQGVINWYNTGEEQIGQERDKGRK